MSNSRLKSEANNIHAIENIFSAAMKRLNVSDYQVDIQGGRFPVTAVTHPYVLLPRLAMNCEQLSVLIFGARLFKDIAFVVHKDSACGIRMNNISDIPEDRVDRNVMMTQSIPVATDATITEGLRRLVIDMAIVESFDIDKDKKLLVTGPANLTIHKIFKVQEAYADGQCIPLMTGDYIAINELHGMLADEFALKALNKARAQAEEMARAAAQRQIDPPVSEM